MNNPTTTTPTNQSNSVVSPECVYTIQDLAAILKVKDTWLKARTGPKSKDRLPHIKVGKYIRFTQSQVAEILSKCRVDAQAKDQTPIKEN